MSNIFDKEDLINFEKKIKNYLNLNNDFKIEYSTEPKIDGISASLTYINGILETRFIKRRWIRGRIDYRKFKNY